MHRRSLPSSPRGGRRRCRRSSSPLLALALTAALAACQDDPVQPPSPSADGVRPASNLISNLTTFTNVSAGMHHTCAVTTEGTVMCWGAGTTITNDWPRGGQSIVPTGLAGVVEVSAGNTHTCALKADQTLTCWGYNAYGQVTGTPTPTLPYYAQESHAGPFTRVSAGGDHTCVLGPNGAVTCWGNNYRGQVTGTPTPLPPPGAPITGAQATHPGPFSDVSAGGLHTCAIKEEDGTVVCWGPNGGGLDFGQMSPPAGLAGVTSLSAGNYHTCAVKADATLVCWGLGTNSGVYSTDYGQAVVPAGVTDVEGVSLGNYHSCALRGDGAVTCWGHNWYGQVSGTPLHEPPYVAQATQSGPFTLVSAGENHTCALRLNGTIRCWGDSGWGQASPFIFGGFYQPVDNPGPNEDAVNRAKAGVGIPVKFSLNGDHGLAIFRPGYPKFTGTACDGNSNDDPIDAVTGSPGGLSYDASTGQYTYVWKTDKAWAGTCGTFELGLIDRSAHHAHFRFVR